MLRPTQPQRRWQGRTQYLSKQEPRECGVRVDGVMCSRVCTSAGHEWHHPSVLPSRGQGKCSTQGTVRAHQGQQAVFTTHYLLRPYILLRAGTCADPCAYKFRAGGRVCAFAFVRICVRACAYVCSPRPPPRPRCSRTSLTTLTDSSLLSDPGSCCTWPLVRVLCTLPQGYDCDPWLLNGHCNAAKQASFYRSQEPRTQTHIGQCYVAATKLR